MIDQLQYATTSRYNFPQLQIMDDLELPKKIIQLSVNSLESLEGKQFEPYPSSFPGLTLNEQAREDLDSLNSSVFITRLTPLKPISDDTPIIAIDVSSVKIGETETGVLCAVRGAVVWNRRMHYRYFRLGPFPFYINEEAKRELIDLLRENQISVLGSSSIIDVGVKLCNLVERWIQMKVCCSTTRSIILLDGSLTAASISNSSDILLRLLKEARQQFNSVLAFCKVTKIRLAGRRITDLFSKYPPPWLFEVHDTPISPSLRNLGNIYIARFKSDGYSFRLDMDRMVPIENKIDAVQKLIGNDLVFQGYPESLRLAHIYSTFTADEVIGIQHYIAQKFRLKAAAKRNVRKILFGPFGTGFND